MKISNIQGNHGHHLNDDDRKKGGQHSHQGTNTGKSNRPSKKEGSSSHSSRKS